jgi:hypothetical protein
MEAGGHYYTVYYTSLAVGFAENVAFRHALLAQMPDQVSWMDAADMHIAQCKGSSLPDFNNITRRVPVAERYRAEYGLHSLPDKNLDATTRSSAYQRQQTTNALLAESPVSLKFGLLLHRLGDTYAHSRIGNEQEMYTVSTGETCFRPGNLWNYDTEFGHGHDCHKPDFPFLRQDLYFSYLKNLYDVLVKKVGEPASANYKRNVRARPFHEVRGDFQMMFVRLESRSRAKREEEQKRLNRSGGYGRGGYRVAPPVSDDAKADMFIEEIRNTALRVMQVEMKKNYAPEKEQLLPLPRYLEQQKGLGSQLDDLKIDSGNLTDTIGKMIPRPGRAGASGSW